MDELTKTRLALIQKALAAIKQEFSGQMRMA